MKAKTNTKNSKYVWVTQRVQGVVPQEDLELTYTWNSLLENIMTNPGDELDDARVLDVRSFYGPPLNSFLKVMEPGLKVEIRIHDYERIFKDLKKRIYWIATVRKICGYYLLLRYEGIEEDDKGDNDFWVNLGSDDVKFVGYSSSPGSAGSCELLPPEFIRGRQENWAKYVLNTLQGTKTFISSWEQERSEALVKCKFKDGTRLELLDREKSTRVRPARVIAHVGTRICIKVSTDDVNKSDLSDEDAQTTTGVWMDESCGLIFPVGWAVYNKYELGANKKYIDHCKAILKCLNDGRPPHYDHIDAQPSHFIDWRKQNVNGSRWKVGMKLECLDPLNQTFLELKIASCLEVLSDGYLKIGFDGPEMMEEAIALHNTSPLIFPLGYSLEHGITLKGPYDEIITSCENYLKETKSTPAPIELFDPLPDDGMMDKFKIHAKLEAMDQCESNLIAPAQIIGYYGRLVRIKFDGWDDNFDQLFDYRSKDIFPLGWCDLYGYRLEQPKEETGTQPPKKKKRSK